jgi:hypothetical protein
MVGHDGEWYLGIHHLGCGWRDVECVSECLDTLDQSRVQIMALAGQVDNHVKAFKARKDFLWCVEEIEREVGWELRERNYGKAESLQALASQCRPLVDAVWTDEWLEAREMMGEVLAHMEP